MNSVLRARRTEFKALSVLGETHDGRHRTMDFEAVTSAWFAGGGSEFDVSAREPAKHSTRRYSELAVLVAGVSPNFTPL